uniref:Wsv115-like protein n=1 Tax=Trachysalambria curvirostris majanivirus TaxID=2984281 RepID=A0A9C7F897_9VIRU|nr:MAG: wsv115-like protein [Trachysalambria curvirostris majanivirus]
MPPLDFSSALPSGGYTEKNHNDADIYSRNKLIQQQIRSLVSFEPITYSFVEIENKGINGWKSLGIDVEKGQALAPFYEISYNIDKLDCDKFSCLPIDIRNNNNNNNSPISCIFNKTPVINVDFGNKDQTYTACSEACYMLNKKIDPHTGIPKASGNLMKKDENGICNYINQSLLLWGTLPQSRSTNSGDIINGYNDRFVPPFAVVDNGMYNKLEITDAYCQYFKRWFDDKEKKCYRKPWMKVLHFTFGTAMSNIYFPQDTNLIETAHNKLKERKLNFKHPNIEKIFGSPLERLTMNEKDEDMAERLYNNHFEAKNQMPKSIANKFASSIVSIDDDESILKRHKRESSKHNQYPYIKKTRVGVSEKEAIKRDIISFIKKKEINANQLISLDTSLSVEDQAEHVIETLTELVVSCTLHKMGDSDIRRMLLSKLLYTCKRNKSVNINNALKIIFLYFRLKSIIFPDGNLNFKNAHNNKNINNENNALFKSKKDLDMFIEDRYGTHIKTKTAKYQEIKERPTYIIQMVKSLTNSNENDKYSSIFTKLLDTSPILPLNKKFRNHIYNIASVLWKDFHDLISPSWSRYNDDFSYSNNFFVLMIADNVINKTLTLMAKACRNTVERLSTQTIESLAARAGLMADDALVTCFSRVVIGSAERFAVNTLVRGAATIALEIFVNLISLVANIIDGIGILFIVGSLVGFILDMALHMEWYDNVMTPKTLTSHINAYVHTFKSATGLTSGEIAPISPRELVDIAVTSEANGLDEYDDTNHNDKTLNNVTYKSFLKKYFDEVPLVENKTDIFLQDAYFEYLGSKTMNSLGQPLAKRNPDKKRKLSNDNKKDILKILHTGAKYMDMVNYNAPRVMAYKLEESDDKHFYDNINSIQQTYFATKWSIIVLNGIVLTGFLVLLSYSFDYYYRNIVTIVFFIIMLSYIYFWSFIISSLNRNRDIIKNFINNSRLFNLNDSDIMNYKDVEKLKENSASIRFFFSEFAKPYVDYLLAK